MKRQRVLVILLSAGCAVYSFFPVLFHTQAQPAKDIEKIQAKIASMDERSFTGFQRLTMVEAKLDGLDKKIDLLINSKEAVTNNVISLCLALLGGGGLTFGVMTKKRMA